MKLSRRRVMIAVGAGVLLALAVAAVLAVAAGVWSRVQPREPAMDLQARFLAGSPCAPPCWEGITPGETPASEAARLLRGNIQLRSVQVQKIKFLLAGNWDTRIYWIGNSSSRMTIGSAIVGSSGIDQLSVEFPQMCLGQIVERYGEPDCAAAYPLVAGEDPANEHRAVRLLWRDLRMIADFGLTFAAQIPAVDAALCSPTLVFLAEGATLKGDQIALAAWHGYDRYEGYLVSEDGCGE